MLTPAARLRGRAVGAERVPILNRIAQASARMRADLLFLLFDCVVLGAAYGVFMILRFDGAIPHRFWRGFEAFLPVALLVHVAAQWMWGLYGRIWSHAGVQEARRVLLSCATAFVVVVPLSQAPTKLIPLSVAGLGCIAGTMLVGASRFEARLFALRRHGELAPHARVVVIGAGEAGAAVIREMLDHPEAGQLPVALLDDDSHKRGRSLLGVPVLGSSSDLADIADRTRANLALLAVPAASRDFVRRCALGAERAGLPLKILRPPAEWTSGRSMRDARAVSIDDLLGREAVAIDVEAVRELCCGRRVLITGAGGSIGAEISRQVAVLGPSQLILLDHDETHLHDLSLTLANSPTVVLGDIRNDLQMYRLFDRTRPDVVFHAAAHKHVPLLESHPDEAVRTNVIGTRNIVNAAEKAGVKRLVFISTDKAVRPANILGYSKRLGEQLVLGSAPKDAAWCAVRFGNVLGSRGSVVPTFLHQIAEGGPVTVTDPRMTRYFMSIPEAVQLVLQASALSTGREIFMLDMGQPMRILDVAERLIRLSGRAIGEDIEVRITGARPGEKLTEELAEPEEVGAPTSHPSIVCLEPLPADLDRLRSSIAVLELAARVAEPDEVARLLEDVSRGAELDLRTIDLDTSAFQLDIANASPTSQGWTWSSATI